MTRWRQVYFDIVSPYPPLEGLGGSSFFYSTGARTGFEYDVANATNFINDETDILRNSGFVTFRQVPDNWAPDSSGNYSLLIWCRREDLGPGVPKPDRHWQIPIRGINYIFSDDNDLQRIRSDIIDASQSAGWGPKHVAARDLIMQKLRIRYQLKDLSAFDILNPWELRETSTFFALALIYKYELSKMPGDIYDEQSKDLLMKAKATFDEYNLSIDTDDDGEHTTDDTRLVSENVVRTVDFEWT